mmetsp:Transcript_72239/g.209142  ORF Transcript_72239/g.209142 Transcript_72239/m.209142 type:complete len:220 (+) Transcript_72239:595-1254(+)
MHIVQLDNLIARLDAARGRPRSGLDMLDHGRIRRTAAEIQAEAPHLSTDYKLPDDLPAPLLLLHLLSQLLDPPIPQLSRGRRKLAGLGLEALLAGDEDLKCIGLGTPLRRRQSNRRNSHVLRIVILELLLLFDAPIAQCAGLGDPHFPLAPMMVDRPVPADVQLPQSAFEGGRAGGTRRVAALDDRPAVPHSQPDAAHARHRDAAWHSPNLHVVQRPYP